MKNETNKKQSRQSKEKNRANLKKTKK